MILILQRKRKNSGAIIGELSVDGVFECYTLEGPTVEIPAGEYSIEVTYSPHFGCELPLLNGVPGRTAIRIHPGNTDKDTEGCILVGTSYTDSAVLNSRVAFAALFTKIKTIINAGESIRIQVLEPPETPPA